MNYVIFFNVDNTCVEEQGGEEKVCDVFSRISCGRGNAYSKASFQLVLCPEKKTLNLLNM